MSRCGCFLPECAEQGWEVIFALNPGDKILIEAGAGDPSQDSDFTDVVWDVGGCSVLTATGIILKCHDGLKVHTVGRVDRDIIVPSSFALQRLAEAEIRAEIREKDRLADTFLGLLESEDVSFPTI